MSKCVNNFALPRPPGVDRLIRFFSVARITTFALEAYLYQLREDGYSVFVVRGNDLPAPGRQPGEGSRDCWYSVKGLLEASRAGKDPLLSTPSVMTFLLVSMVVCCIISGFVHGIFLSSVTMNRPQALVEDTHGWGNGHLVEITQLEYDDCA